MRVVTPFDFLVPALEAFAMLAEAQMVVGLRLAGLAGFWPMGRAESNRMVTEKLSAGMASAHAALQAGMAGDNLPEVAMAAMKPLRQKTKSNARRLRRKVTGV